ncbi:MAG: rhomboid family intramembrane serine protease, partial [Verrucomicrobia bacterium]
GAGHFQRSHIGLVGQTRFFQLLLISALGGAIAWMGIHFTRSDSVLGASGIVMGLLAVYACLYPRRPFTLMLFFVIPVTVQPIWLVTILGGIDLIGFLFSELPGRGSLYGVAHSCHLGGLAAGWIFYQTVLARSMGWTPGAAAAIEPPSWLSRRPKQASPKFTVNLGGASAAPERPTGLRSSRATSRDVLRAEVDRILDKINVQGFGSLTADEKRVLDEARNHLHPR